MNTLTVFQLVTDDDEESDASTKGVHGDGDFTQDARDLPTGGADDLLIRAFITDLVEKQKSCHNKNCTMCND